MNGKSLFIASQDVTSRRPAEMVRVKTKGNVFFTQDS